MVLKFKYISEDGRLESYQNYKIAQNSSLSNTIVVTSTDPNAQNYNYCLEFLCYNSKNVPKTQYISTILEYSQEGITFVVPASLTQYKGHVDMQLTGFSIEDNSIVFKSINKGAKAFDVEGSLNVLESDVGSTPNILTEIFEELAFYRKTRDDFAQNVQRDTEKELNEAVAEIDGAVRKIDEKIDATVQEIDAIASEIDKKFDSVKQDVDKLSTSAIQEITYTADAKRQEIANIAEAAKQEVNEFAVLIKQDFADIRSTIAESVKQEIADSVQGIIQGDVFYKVTFRFNGEIIKSITVREGAKVNPPEFTLPTGCEVEDGWYDISKNKLWNFDEDSVFEDVVLTLNFMSKGITFMNTGKIKNFANLKGDIYLPDYHNGKRITQTDANVVNLSDGVNLHFGYNILNYAGVLSIGSQVKNMYFPKDSKMRNRANGVYTDREQAGLVSFVFAPRNTDSTLYIQSDCQELGGYAISNVPNLKKIVIPPTVTGLNSNCIYNTGITSITIPASVTFCNAGALLNNVNLTSIYLEGDLSESINGGTFVDRTNDTIVRPALYVRPEHYQKYIDRGLQEFYTINVMSKEYFDANYSAKEE